MKYVHPSGTHQAQIRNNKISEKNGEKHKVNPLFFEKVFLKIVEISKKIEGVPDVITSFLCHEIIKTR